MAKTMFLRTTRTKKIEWELNHRMICFLCNKHQAEHYDDLLILLQYMIHDRVEEVGSEKEFGKKDCRKQRYQA